MIKDIQPCSLNNKYQKQRTYQLTLAKLLAYFLHHLKFVEGGELFISPAGLNTFLLNKVQLQFCPSGYMNRSRISFGYK